MSLPYENATSGNNAVREIEKVLHAFGCSNFGFMSKYDQGEILVQFRCHGRDVLIRASINGYAAAWLKAHPYNRGRTRATQIEHERRAREVAGIAVYSIVRDWVKGQITAISTGIMSFEGAFLGQILLSNGRTVYEEAQVNILPKMLPASPVEEIKP